MAIKELQIGKNRITENVITTLKTYFIKNKIVKISVLKSARENREDTKLIAEKLVQSLGKNYTVKIIGFTIILKKWRKEQKS
jgi:RNA-binding protein YhbY